MILLVAADALPRRARRSFWAALLARPDRGGVAGDQHADRRRRPGPVAARAAAGGPPPGACSGARTRRVCCSSRSTGSRCRCSSGRCAAGTRPNLARWLEEDGYRLSSGRRTCRRRPAPARPASCWAPTTTSRPSAGSRRRPAGSSPAPPPPTAPRSRPPRRPGSGLLTDGGASRGNLLSGEADEVILTVSRMDASAGRTPGYRAFLANGAQRDPLARALRLGGRRSSGWRPRASAGATSGRAGTAAARTRSARDAVRPRARPHRLRRPHGHDARPARRATRPSRATTRWPTTPASSAPTRWRRCASSTSASAASGACATPRARTSSSSSPTTARPRARRSSSATATALDELVRGRSAARG